MQYSILDNIMRKCQSRDLQISILISECSPGYLGPNCSEICPYPNYGRECQEMCECEENRCDITTGCYPQNGTKHDLILQSRFGKQR